MKLLTGNSNKVLSKNIAKYLKSKLVNSSIRKFADGEIYIEINENIRGNSVFVIQSTSNPANDNLMELLLCIDALRRSSAKNITAVIPYYGYARQDRKVVPRTSISAKVVANLLTNAGANRIVTVDLHAGQIQGFFDMPVDNLFTTPLFSKFIKRKISSKKLICVSPDMGGVARTRALATRLKADLAIIDKRRPAPGKSQVMNIIGDVANKTCIIVDDIIDSGGTIVNAVDALKKKGAKEVYVEGLGCKCVEEEPWVTAAESSELAIALSRIGLKKEAEEVLQNTFNLIDEDGLLWTGYVFKDKKFWPIEKPSWTMGAAILAGNSINEFSPSHNFFNF